MLTIRLRNTLMVGILLLMAAPCHALTVTGKVFVDANSDGVMQATELGLRNAAVSDGLTVVLTDNTGGYRLETAAGRIVFVSLPKGYRAARGFCRTVEGPATVDFPMSVWAESLADSLRFVQITDLHTSKEDAVNAIVDDLAGTNAMDPKPAFVVATGDLVNNGNNVYEFENVMKVVSRVKAQVFLGIGNHDVMAGHDSYRRICGPDYYSFNAGPCHFVMLDCTTDAFNDVQKAWLTQDLAAAPKGARLVICQHYLPSLEAMSYFAELHPAAILSGHWHGSRTVREFGILNLNTPTFRFAGIDRTPASFRVVDIAKDTLTSELRFTGQRQRAAIVAPVGSVSPSEGQISVLVNAYDTWAGVKSAECNVAGASYPLTKVGPWSWAAKIPIAAIGSGERSITATAHGSGGAMWSASSTFRLNGGRAEVKTGADWSQWRGGLARQGAAADLVSPPLKLAWFAATGALTGMSSPAVSGGIVAVGVAELGDFEGCGVAAYDAETGSPRWRYHTDTAVKGSPVIVDGRVFAISIAGFLYALDASTGKSVWKAELRRDHERWETTTPAVANGIVYAGGPFYLAAFRADTGERLWERSITASVDKKTGARIWGGKSMGGGSLGSDDWIPSVYTSPTPVGDKLLVATRGGLFALDLATGEPAWKLDGLCRGGAVVDDVIYTVQAGLARAVRVSSGEVLWTGTEKLQDSASAPAVSGGAMVVGTGEGKVCAFSTKDGAPLWSFQTSKAITDTMPYRWGNADVNSSPAISGDVVYVGAGDGNLYALSLKTGKKLWSYSIGVPIVASPAVSGNAVFLTGYDGNVYAFAARK